MSGLLSEQSIDLSTNHMPCAVSHEKEWHASTNWRTLERVARAACRTSEEDMVIS